MVDVATDVDVAVAVTGSRFLRGKQVNCSLLHLRLLNATATVVAITVAVIVAHEMLVEAHRLHCVVPGNGRIACRRGVAACTGSQMLRQSTENRLSTGKRPVFLEGHEVVFALIVFVVQVRK